MNIFEIEKSILDTINQIEENEGEITPEIEEQLVINDTNFKNKIEGYVNVIKMLGNDVDAIDNETKRLANLKKVKNNTINKLKLIVTYAINNFGETSKSGAKFVDYGTGKVSVRKSISVKEDEEAIDTIGNVFFETVYALNANNQLYVNDRLDVQTLLNEINYKLDLLNKEPITEDDLVDVYGSFTFNFNLFDVATKHFDWFRHCVETNETFKLSPKIDKNQMKIKLAQADISHLAKFEEKESLLTK